MRAGRLTPQHARPAPRGLWPQNFAGRCARESKPARWSGSGQGSGQAERPCISHIH